MPVAWKSMRSRGVLRTYPALTPGPLNYGARYLDASDVLFPSTMTQAMLGLERAVAAASVAEAQHYFQSLLNINCLYLSHTLLSQPSTHQTDPYTPPT
jgi:hypothetical protein